MYRFTDFLFAILLLGLISTSFALSQENCESSVSERILLLRNNFEAFKTKAFDPLDPTTPVTTYKTFPQGGISYGTNSDVVFIVDGALQLMDYIDEHDDDQRISINSVGKDFEVTHNLDVIAQLSTIQVLNEPEVKKPEYIPLLKKMIAMYKSAIQFHENLEKKNIPGIDGKVTFYEITADGHQFEKDFTLKIEENISKTEINGTYICYFDESIDKYGHYGNDYVVSSDQLTLGDKYVSLFIPRT